MITEPKQADNCDFMDNMKPISGVQGKCVVIFFLLFLSNLHDLVHDLETDQTVHG